MKAKTRFPCPLLSLLLKQVQKEQQPKGKQQWGWVDQTLVWAICVRFSPAPAVMAT